MRKLLLIAGALLTLAIVATMAILLIRPTPDDLGLTSHPAQTIDPDDVVVRWFGVSTLLIEDDETRLMIDGFISRPSLLDLALDRAIAPDEVAIERALNDMGASRLDAVMTVHSHYDHAMDTGVVARLTGARVLGSASTANVARGADVPEAQITEIETGISYPFGRFTVTFYPSRHAPLVDDGPPMPGTIDVPLVPPQPVSAWREGGSFSIVIRHPDVAVLVQGSAGFEPGELQGVKVDVVFLGAGGLSRFARSHVAQYVEEIVKRTEADKVFLIHHEDFITAPFGEIRLMPTLAMDDTFIFELEQLLLPARLYHLEFGQAVKLDRPAPAP